MISVTDAITSRKSVRSYTKKVSIALIKKILYLSSRAPSGTNTQPWHVNILYGDKLKSFTAKAKQNFKKF